MFELAANPTCEAAYSDFLDYRLVNMTERQRVIEQDVSTYIENENLGRDLHVTVLVKWTNQKYHDSNLRARHTDNWDTVRGISAENRSTHKNQYYPGLIVSTSLDLDTLNEAKADTIIQTAQPTGIAFYRDLYTAVASANNIMLYDRINPSAAPQLIKNPNFARLHDIDFSEDGSKLLTASSAMDMLYELDHNGQEIWSLDLWNILNTNQVGQQFRRTAPKNIGEWILNPDATILEQDPSYRQGKFVIDDPLKYEGLGLPTYLIPAYVNSISYGHKDDILVTLFHKGQAWIINRSTGEIKIVADDMEQPHGLRRDPLLDGYMVTDTGHEQVRFFSKDYQEELRVDFTSLPGRKPNQEKVRWLQYVTRLENSLYCAVLSTHQSIVLFDMLTKERRTIPMDPNWGLQLVVKS